MTMARLKVSLNDFNEAFENLNNILRERNLNIEVKAIGGYAMLCRGLREYGYTMDADTITPDYPEEINEIIKSVANKLDLDEDWLNNDAYKLPEVQGIIDQLNWEEGKSYSNIKMFLADLDSLLLLKVRAIDGGGVIPRSTDKSDLLNILKFMGINDVGSVINNDSTKFICNYDLCLSFLKEKEMW